MHDPTALIHVDAISLLAASHAARALGQHREGARLAGDSAMLAEHAGEPAHMALAMALLSFHQLRLGDCEASIAAGRKALKQFRDSGDVLAQSQVHSTLALAHFNAGLTKETLAHAVQALSTARASGDMLAQCWALNRMGIAHDSVGRIEKMFEYLGEAYQLALELNDTETTFGTLNNLARGGLSHGESLKERGEDPKPTFHQALAHAEAALVIAEPTGNRFYEAMSLAAVGNLMGLVGRSAQAQAHLERARGMAIAHGFRSVELDAEVHLACLWRERNDLATACAGLQVQLRANVDGKVEAQFAVKAHRMLYEMLKALGKFESALAHHEQFYVLERREREARADMQSRILINQAELDQARAAVERSGLEATQQRQRAEELDKIAHHDALTGLHNRRYIDLHLPMLAAKARSLGMPLSISMLDIDRFKLVNDLYGHALGDLVLAKVAELLRANARSSDLTVRQGGEEFLIVFVDTTLAQAAEVCEQLRLAVQNYDWEATQPGLKITLSQGLSGCQEHEALAHWFARTDAALYQAKDQGRNRVVQTAESQPEGT